MNNFAKRRNSFMLYAISFGSMRANRPNIGHKAIMNFLGVLPSLCSLVFNQGTMHSNSRRANRYGQITASVLTSITKIRVPTLPKCPSARPLALLQRCVCGSTSGQH